MPGGVDCGTPRLSTPANRNAANETGLCCKFLSTGRAAATYISARDCSPMQKSDWIESDHLDSFERPRISVLEPMTVREAIANVAGGLALIAAQVTLPLGVLYFLVRFVKWAWYR